MKDNYLGNILIAFAVGTLVFFAGAHACESYPFLAKWVGGECWFQSDEEMTSTMNAQELYLQAGVLASESSVALNKEDDEVMKAAIYALGQSGTSQALLALKKIIRTHESLEIRKAALYALAQGMDAKELVDIYQEVAERGDFLELRKAAIYALGQAESLETVSILETLARSNHHVSLRKAAVHALQNCDSDQAQKALYRILSDVSDAL
ncbi:MAG: HEAT repeat domain-containing protein [Rhodothermales bacterium]